jgi:hypothetical protein
MFRGECNAKEGAWTGSSSLRFWFLQGQGFDFRFGEGASILNFRG